MKRMVFFLALVVAMAACKKGEQGAPPAAVPDTSSQMMSPDTSRMSDTSHAPK